MKTTNELRIDLAEKSLAAMGFDLSLAEQGSAQWHKARLGVITASQAHNIIKKGRGGKVSAQRETYMLELIAEVLTGKSKSVSGAALDWGNNNEEASRHAFNEQYGDFTEEIPFIYSDNMRCGYSPDGLLGTNSAIEIKCPYNTENHLRTVLSQEVKPEYITQMQYGLWITERESCHFVTHDPRILSKYKTYSIEFLRDEELMKRFNDEIPKFIDEMDGALKEFGVEFGSQWES